MASDSFFTAYYVHRRAENYLRSGIHPVPSESTKPNEQLFADLILKKHNNIIHKQSKQRIKILKSLENQYEQMLFGKGLSGKNVLELENRRNQMLNALNALLQEKFNSAIQVGERNLAKAVISGDNYSDEFQQALIKNMDQTLKKITNSTYITHQRLNKIMDALKTWVANLQASGTSFEEFINNFNNDERNFERIITNINTLLTENTASTYLIAENSSIQELNVLLDWIHKNSINLSNVQGEIGEWIAPWINYFLTGQAPKIQNEVTKEVQTGLQALAKSSQKGAGGAYLIYNKITGEIKKEVDRKGKEDFMKKDQIKQNKDAKLAIRYHVNKTDAEFILNQNNKSSLEKVSIKNLSSFNDIDLVSNTSLAPVLDYELGKAEQMHLANIFAAHSDKDIAFKSSAQKLIENLVIQTAVRGYSKQNRPTMFMAINSSAQQVHIYDINILISQLLNNEIKHSKIIIKTIDNDLSEPKTRSQMLADTATVFDHFRQQKINFQISLALK